MAGLAQVLFQGRPQLCELGENQQTFPFGHGFFHHFRQAGELVGAVCRKVAAILQKLHGVVAHLLQLHQGGENQPLALDAFGLLELLFHIGNHRFVEGGPALW